MAWTVVYDPDVPDDLRTIPTSIRRRVGKAIEERLTTEPDRFGERLRKDLAGAWRLRVGDYRVVFDLAPKPALVTVLLIAHRRLVYGPTLVRRRRKR
jgi:mRNA interferase RelE/StbE